MTTSPQPSNTSPPADAGFELRDLMRAVLRHKWVVVALTLVGAILSIFWTLRQPQIYQAACSIEYDPNPPRPLRGAIQDFSDPFSSYWNNREFFETQNLVIGSRAVTERVVRRLSLHMDATFMGTEDAKREAFRGVSVDRAAGRLQRLMVVDQVPETRLVRIKVKDENPERAALIANSVAEAYIEKSVEDRLGSTVSAIEWLSTQLDDIQHRLNGSEQALHDFKEEHNVLSLSMVDRQNIVANDIQRLSEAFTTARTRRIEISARLERMRSAAQSDPLEVRVGDNDVLNGLRESYRQAAAQRDSLATYRGANHPEIKSLEAQLQSIRAEIQAEVHALVTSAQADLLEIRRVESGLSSALAEVNSAGLELNLREMEYNRLNRARENNEKLYAVLLQRTTEANLTKMLRVTHAHVVDRALKPAKPISPKIQVNVASGTIAGLLLGLVVAFVLLRLDRTIKSIEDVEERGLTVLGILPTITEEGEQPRRGTYYGRKRPGQREVAGPDKDLIVHTHPMSSVAECCRTIRTNLTFMSPDNPMRTLVVTSPGPREGKTTVTVSVAIALAQSGKRVLLVDTDLRRPRVHRALKVSGAVGTTTALVGDRRPLVQLAQKSHVPGLWVLPCGPIPPNPSELLHTERFRELIAEAEREFEVVLFDSPPLGAVTDAAIVAPQVQGAIVVVKAGQTSRDTLKSSIRQLNDVGANVVGAVLNDVDLSERKYGYGAYYYYRREGYYGSDDERDQDDSAEAAE